MKVGWLIHKNLQICITLNTFLTTQMVVMHHYLTVSQLTGQVSGESGFTT